MSELQVTALAMLYIGRFVTCGIDYLFTPQTNIFFLHEKTQHKRVFGIEGKLYTRDVFYVRREEDLMKTAKVNAYVMHIFGKIELLSIYAT